LILSRIYNNAFSECIDEYLGDASDILAEIERNYNSKDE